MGTTANRRNTALKEAMTKTQILEALSESTGLQRKDVASVLEQGRSADRGRHGPVCRRHRRVSLHDKLPSGPVASLAGNMRLAKAVIQRAETFRDRLTGGA